MRCFPVYPLHFSYGVSAWLKEPVHSEVTKILKLKGRCFKGKYVFQVYGTQLKRLDSIKENAKDKRLFLKM